MKHTIYLRDHALYLNYTKNAKRERVSLNKLIKSLNLNHDEALEYLKGLSLEQILKRLKTLKKGQSAEKKQKKTQAPPKKSKDMTIEQAKESFLNQKIGLKESSLYLMRSRFKAIFKLMGVKEHFKISKITKESVTNYHNNAFKVHKKNTLTAKNSLLKSFLEFCEQEGYTDKSPYFKITLKNATEAEKIEPFSLNEIKALLNETPSLRLKAFLMTAFFTGLRTGEQLALLWSDVDFKNKKINIDKSINLKGQITSPKNKSSIRQVDLLEPVEK
ncbi:TPA: tyrosine-type recombinase/integrase, partial [Enterococcus faecium]|nr:tyrosine-type recombinase/integrase [Enterococcus faecium]